MTRIRLGGVPRAVRDTDPIGAVLESDGNAII